MKLSVLSGLSNRPLLFWLPKDIRTSSACVVLLNFLSWHVTSSWMHHGSRHNTLQETSYEVLPMSSCGHYHIHSNIASCLRGSPGCSSSSALLQHWSHFWLHYENWCIWGKGHGRQGQRQYAAWSTHRKVASVVHQIGFITPFMQVTSSSEKLRGKEGERRAFQMNPEQISLFSHWNQKVSISVLAEIR